MRLELARKEEEKAKDERQAKIKEKKRRILESNDNTEIIAMKARLDLLLADEAVNKPVIVQNPIVQYSSQASTKSSTMDKVNKGLETTNGLFELAGNIRSFL